MTSAQMWNTLNKDRSLYQTTVRYMKQYRDQFGSEALSNIFNIVTKDDKDAFWQANKVCDFNGVGGLHE